MGITVRPLAWRNAARAAIVLALLLGSPGSAFAGDPEPATAMLISARSELPDPFFKDSVVLVMNNVAPVPAGVILNRPTNIDVSLLLPDIPRIRQLHDKVYFGGPVDPGTVWFVFAADKAPQHAVRVLDGVYISASAELLHKLLDREKPMEGLRIYAGHAMWSPGQLESEIARGDWALAPADKEAIFHGKSEHPWPDEPALNGTSRT